MKKTLLILITVCSFLVGISIAKPTGMALDNIVAVINDDVVTQTELNHALFIMKAQLTHTHAAMPDKAKLQKQALDQLINKKLQLQLAKQAGIAVKEEDVDRIVNRVASQNNISTDGLYQRISQEGLSKSTYRNDLRDQLTIQRLQQQAVGGRLSVSPEEVNRLMHSNLWQRNVAKEYRLEDILIPVADNASAQDTANAKQQAEALVAKLKKGLAFDAVARQAKAQQAAELNNFGWLKIEDVPTAFSSDVMSMQTNDISNPIQTGNGFHILHIAGIRALGGQSNQPDRKQAEQILMQQKFEQHVQSWISKMRSQAFIVIHSSNKA